MKLAPRDNSEKGRWSAFAVGLNALVVISVVAGLLLFYGFYYAVHHDLAGGALSGRLAVTLSDSYRNYSVYFPPAERSWFSIAARLTDLTGLRLDLSIVVMTGAAVLFSAGLAYRIRCETVGAAPPFFALSVALLIVIPILFRNVFGVREHIVALGLWPYFVLRVSDPDGTRVGWKVRLLLGLWMGATLLLKYLYSIIVLLVELVDALVQRRPPLLFRIENIAAGAIVALYLFCWLILDPSQSSAIGAMFSAIDANLEDPAANWLKVAENIGYAFIFLALLVYSEVPKRLIILGLATVVGAILVAWTQERWYPHHLFPIFSAYVVSWWMTKGYLRWWGQVALVLCLSYPLTTLFIRTFAFQGQVTELSQALSEAGKSVSGKRVGILTMHPSPYNEYLASHGAYRWNALVNTAYVAAELKSFDTMENTGKLVPPVKLDDPGRRTIHEQMLRLWEDMPPDILILDRSSSWPLHYVNVDWKHVFSEDPRFIAILKHYRPVLVYQGKRVVFTYYVRADQIRQPGRSGARSN